MKPFVLTNQEGRHFNLSAASEFLLQLETEDQLPEGKPDSYNTCTLIAKTVTGAVQLFPYQTISTLVNDIMPGLAVNFFSRWSSIPSGKFYHDPRKKPRETIQPLFSVFGYIDGSDFRKLDKEYPKAVTLSAKERAELIKEHKIEQDFLFIHGVPYTVLWELQRKVGVEFYPDAQAVLDKIEEHYPGSIEQNENRSYIEQNVRLPFEELKKLRREQGIRQKNNEEAHRRSGLRLIRP